MIKLEEVIKRYVWLMDEKCFYDKVSRHTKSSEFVGRKLMEASDFKAASQTLDLMMLEGVTRDKLKVAKPSVVAQVAIVYERVKPGIKLRRVRSKGEFGLYEISTNNEVTFMGIANTDKFAVLVSSDHDLFREIIAAHEALPELHAKMDPLTLIKKLFDRFVIDPDMELRQEPALISWDPAIPAYKILDPSMLVPGPHPSWDSFTARLSHPEIFKAYLWSIFDPKNDGRQALWIRGEGMDGKSSIVNAISTFLGRDHVFSIGQDSIDQRWFFSSTYGKRLGIYMDCMNLQLLRKEKIKSILGGDTVEIDEKNEKIFSAKVRSKLIVLSNYPAHINYNDKSELTRLIYLTVKTYSDTKGDPNFEPSLVSELPHFLHSCREVYPELCPKGSQITVPQDMHELIQRHCASLDADLIEEFIGATLEIKPDTFITKLELTKLLKEFFKANHATNVASFSFENLLKKLKDGGMREGRVLKSGISYKAYIGIGVINSKNKVALDKDVVYD